MRSIPSDPTERMLPRVSAGDHVSMSAREEGEALVFLEALGQLIHGVAYVLLCVVVETLIPLTLTYTTTERWPGGGEGVSRKSKPFSLT